MPLTVLFVMDKEDNRLASRDGDIEKVKRLVKEGADPNGCDEHGNTSFHWCCMSDNCPVEVLSFLVSSSSTSVSLSKLRNNDGSTPMHLAFSYGNLELIKYIYKTDTSSMTECDYNDKMPVHYTTQNTEILSFVISVLESSNIEVYKRIKIAVWCCMCVWESFLNIPGSFSTLQHLIKMMTFQSFLCEFEKEEDKKFIKFIIEIKKLQFKDICAPLLHKVVKQGDVGIVKRFVNKIGCSINSNSMDEDGNTLLHIACYHNHFAIVKLLTNHKECYIEATDLNGRSALHVAAQQGHLQIIKHLVESKQCDTNKKDKELFIPLHLACLNGHLNVVKYLKSCSNIEERCKDGVTVIHLAALKGHIQILKYLVEQIKCDVNTITTTGLTPLDAACYGGNHDVVEYLSNNAEFKNGLTALHSASGKGHLEVVKHLVERKGCDINVKADNNETPYHKACYTGHLDVVEYLSSNTLCDVHGKDKFGWTALHLAAEGGHLEVVKHLMKRKGCDINVKADNNETPYHRACYTGHLDVVEYLSSNTLCDVHGKDKFGWTALHLAAEGGHLEVVKHLVENKGCDINVKSNNNQTPLHIAYQRNWNVGIDLLMNKPSCDVNVQDSDGNTLLHLACKRGDTSMIKQLISHPKCDINFLNKKNETPLHLVIISRYNRAPAIVELLLKTNKCDVSIPDKDGNTLLHQACQRVSSYDSLQLVKLLTASPVCDINAENNEGVRPIHLAAEHGNLGVVCHLVNCGCDLTATDKHGNTPMDYSTSTDIKYFLNKVVYGTPGNLKSELIQYAFININSFFILS